MNRNEFNRFVAGIDLPGPGDLEGLRELTVLFPWFHSAHLVLLKGLRENSDIRFDSQLKASALSVNDREVLYHYLFLPPDQVSPEPEIPVNEEVSVPEEKIIAPVEVSPEPENLIKEEVSVPEEEHILSPTEAEELLTPDVPEVIMASDVAAVSEGQGILASDEAAVTDEGQGLLASDEAAVTDEGQAEESPGDEIDVTEADPNVRLRTREELLAEIEERLKELESYRHLTFKEQKAEVINETVVSPEPVPEEVSVPVAAAAERVPEEVTVPLAAAELVPEGATEPLAADALVPEAVSLAVDATEPQSEKVPLPDREPEPEPEIEEVPAKAPEIIEAPEPELEIEEPPSPEPGIEEPPAPEQEAAPEPDLEHESTELLELLPEIVAEDQQPQPEKKLSPADLIDRFIMISPNIERMSPKDYQPVRDLSEQDSGEPGKFITETLAKIYINQGYYTRAINIYEKLTLQYPEKSAYFASRIEKIKDLIK